jgi:hypothetical protein
VLVSIVIDNFDYGRFIGDAIDSALAQTHPEVEVVVVDDGSTDDSRAVVARYGDRVRAVLKDNGGQASAVNAGFAASRGDLVAFLDADDTLDPGTLAAAATEYERAPFAKLHWHLREVEADGGDRGRLDPPAPLDEGDLLERLLDQGPGAYVTPPMSGNVYARAALERLMPVPETIRMCADGFLYEVAPLYGRVARLPAPGGTLRKHPSWFGGVLLEERLPRTVHVHEHVIRALATRARELGREPREERWRERSWPLRQLRALRELDAVVPSATPFVLVDEGRFGLEPTLRRPALPLPAGLSDEAALAELGRLRERGAAFAVVPWSGFAWLAGAQGFAAHLRSAHEVVLDNERLLVVALR